MPFAGGRAWAASNPDSRGKRLVVVFLRGAVDGLSVVPPWGDPDYEEARPTIAIRRGGGAIDLDDRFGLHPALAALTPFWQDRSLAFIHACGSPDQTRSHFDAQDYMESGTPGVKTTMDGWMNRLLGVLPGPRHSTEAIAFGPTMPRILSGKQNVANVPLGRGANAPSVLDRPVINAAFDQLYTGNDPLSHAYKEGLAAHKAVLADLQTDMAAADNGAPSPIGFDTDVQHLATMIKQDPTIDLAFFALGGWDTHINQGAAEGQLANHLKPLGDGLAVLARDLGSAYGDTVILVISEFGRTVHENGNRGTDHGHGNVMWVMGGPVAGGKVYGAWPGLSTEVLHDGRDLAVTTDFRTAVGAVLAGHMGLTDAQLDQVFPERPTMSADITGIIRV
ncbi:MAG: DUF1501 domain-containing protein [Rhodospirillaceae bacterium]|nr:MAG: DUF1501 domain-containing protein [Rhodospirillaceae bacterium]